MIFDRVVGSTLDIVGDDSPRVTLKPVEDKENPLLFLTPLVFLDCWV